MPKKTKLLLTTEEIRNNEGSLSHPANPNSLIIGTKLSRLVRLERTGVSLVRIPPGKESFIYHTHEYEEEWLYILSGKGRAEIDEEIYEVKAGDFMGFPTPSIAHHLTNPYEQDLVYLMGGENAGYEVNEFPRLGTRAYRRGDKIDVFNIGEELQ